jgi:hypothetical protein
MYLICFQNSSQSDNTDELYNLFVELEKENDELRRYITELEQDNGNERIFNTKHLK